MHLNDPQKNVVWDMFILIVGIVTILVILTMQNGCTPNQEFHTMKETIQYAYVIPPENLTLARSWIIELTYAANPHSDEEPEDYIQQVETTAYKLFGELTIGMRVYATGYKGNFLPYDKCNARQQAVINQYIKQQEP